MIALLEQKKTAVIALCRQFNVERLDLFGSAASGEFHAESSDLDFVVRFANREPTGAYADRYLDFAEALERLFQRSVDLVTEQSIRNPYFRREVEATRQPIYERQDAEAVV